MEVFWILKDGGKRCLEGEVAGLGAKDQRVRLRGRVDAAVEGPLPRASGLRRGRFHRLFPLRRRPPAGGVRA